jgi:gamma-glutamylcyclotransferase (GGCT)/AIG2-like uncharacterized protein YtfP
MTYINAALPVFAFYGTLMSSEGRGYYSEPYGRVIGPATIPGKLYSVGRSFPALVKGDGVVQCELWQPYPGKVAQATGTFDQIEGYDEDNPRTSMYLRIYEVATLPDGTDVPVQTYLWNSSMGRLHLIKSGDWRQHCATRPDEEAWAL